jgi:hypothetical protein
MTVATRMPPPRGAPNGAALPRPKIGKLTGGTFPAPRIILNAVEGWGKTSYGAYATNPAILMSRGETGYVALKGAGRVPDNDCVELATWKDVLATIDDLAADVGGHGAIVLDAMGGFERLCHEYVCTRDFDGDWGEKGFTGYARGYDVAIPEWLQLLTRLDRVRALHNIPIVILSHAKIKPFKNPTGPDFDRYVADCHDKTWGVTHKWSDAAFFGTYVTVAVKDKKGAKRMKGIGGTERTMYTERRDAFDAKNRYGMPPQMDVPDDPAQVWSAVWDSIKGKTPVTDDVPPAL